MPDHNTLGQKALSSYRETGTPYLDVTVGSYWTPDAEAVALLRASVEMCRREGVGGRQPAGAGVRRPVEAG